MALIAKEVLKIGHAIAAMPGNVVAPEAVAEYGWEDKVTDDRKGPVGGTDGDPEKVTTAKRRRK